MVCPLHVGPDQTPEESVEEWSEYVIELVAGLVTTLLQFRSTDTTSPLGVLDEEFRLKAQLRRIRQELDWRVPVFAAVLAWAARSGMR